MGSPANDILPGEEPMSPSEAPDVVERLQIKEHGFRVTDRKISHPQFLRCGSNMGKEVPMRLRAIGTELVKDFGQRSVGHGDLKKVVEKGNL